MNPAHSPFELESLALLLPRGASYDLLCTIPCLRIHDSAFPGWWKLATELPEMQANSLLSLGPSWSCGTCRAWRASKSSLCMRQPDLLQAADMPLCWLPVNSSANDLTAHCHVISFTLQSLPCSACAGPSMWKCGQPKACRAQQGNNDRPY